MSEEPQEDFWGNPVTAENRAAWEAEQQRRASARSQHWGYVWSVDEYAFLGQITERRAAITAANGQGYQASESPVSKKFSEMGVQRGALVFFTGNPLRQLALEIHEVRQPKTARIIDYDIMRRAWVARNFKNMERFHFCSERDSAFVSSYQQWRIIGGEPCLGATVTYHTDEYGAAFGVMMNSVPRPVLLWRTLVNYATLPLIVGLSAFGFRNAADRVACIGGTPIDEKGITPRVPRSPELA